MVGGVRVGGEGVWWGGEGGGGGEVGSGRDGMGCVLDGMQCRTCSFWIESSRRGCGSCPHDPPRPPRPAPPCPQMMTVAAMLSPESSVFLGNKGPEQLAAGDAGVWCVGGCRGGPWRAGLTFGSS